MDKQPSEEQRKKYAEVIAKAWSDENFKKKLLEHPREALKEMGVDVPTSSSIKVCDSSDGTFYLVLPQKPSGNLDADSLKNITGGMCGCGNYYCTGNNG